MQVLVVGGTGFIGETLCRELHERGHEVTALARSPEDAELPDGVERVMGDVTAYDSIEAAFEGQDVVVNLVATSPLFRPKGGDERHFNVIRDGAANVVRAAETHGVSKLVQISALGADPDGDTAYIQAKGLAEKVIRNSSLNWVFFRPSVVFGDGDEFVGFTKKLAPPYLTPLPGGGKTRFQPIWVDDLVPMVADAVEGVVPDADETDDADETGGADETDETDETDDADETNGDELDDPHIGRAYDIGGPEVLTLADVATLAHAADNKPVDIVPVPMALAKIGLSMLDFIPGAPFGSDQYRSLQFDNTIADNDVSVFGVDEDDLTTLAEYLGVDAED